MSDLNPKLFDEDIKYQKTAFQSGCGDNNGSEFPDVTEQASFISDYKKAPITEGLFVRVGSMIPRVR